MIARQVSSLFGVGFIPFMPGTFGSLVTLALSLPLAFTKSGFAWAVPATVLAASLLAGFPAVSRVLETSEDRDPKWVVVDESAGQSLAILMAPPAWWWYLGAFVLFRFFDILKPFPIRRLERLKGAWGVFADDLLAGIISGAVILAASRFL